MEDSIKSNVIYPSDLFDTEGRIGRVEYVAIYLFSIIVAALISGMISHRNPIGQLMIFIVVFLALVPTAVKRLHDTDKNGAWVWALLIPFVNIIVQLWLLFKAGTPSANRFGIRPNMKGAAEQLLLPIIKPWWKLDKRLRLVIVASMIWMLGAYLIQEKYEKDMGVVFIPVFSALILHFLVRFTVDRSDHQSDVVLSAHSQSVNRQPTATSTNNLLNEIGINIINSSSEKNIESTQSNLDHPYGIKLINGMYQFRDTCFLRVADAIFAAERTLKGEKNPTPQREETLNPNEIYAEIAQEFEIGNLDKGLWIRLFADCDGDETRTKVRYIKERVLMLTTQQPSHTTQRFTFSDDNMRAKDSVDSLESFVPMELSPKEREKAMEELTRRMRSQTVHTSSL
jgi:uncharacterized membrane protein YhaH (DUF805 family)